MLPHIPGPDPKAFGTVAIIVALGVIGALTAAVTLVGWSVHEMICLMDGYDDVRPDRLEEIVAKSTGQSNRHLNG